MTKDRRNWEPDLPGSSSADFSKEISKHFQELTQERNLPLIQFFTTRNFHVDVEKS